MALGNRSPGAPPSYPAGGGGVGVGMPVVAASVVAPPMHVDTTGDGRNDAVAYDTTGDGRHDTCMPTIPVAMPAANVPVVAGTVVGVSAPVNV